MNVIRWIHTVIRVAHSIPCCVHGNTVVRCLPLRLVDQVQCVRKGTRKAFEVSGTGDHGSTHRHSAYVQYDIKPQVGAVVDQADQ